MRTPARQQEAGIALIIVMITITFLSILAAVFAFNMKVETKLAQNANSEEELTWLGRSGVEYAKWILAQQLATACEPYDGLNQKWAGGPGGICASNSPLADISLQNYPLGDGTFSVTIKDLERKVNINIADQTMLEQALRIVGADPGNFTTIVSSILDWIDSDSLTHIDGAESDYYLGLDPPYSAKNKPLDDLSELLLVKGVTPEIYWGSASTNHPSAAFQARVDRYGRPLGPVSYPAGLADLFTPISAGRININTASAEVLRMIRGVDDNLAEAIVAARGGEDDGSGQTGPFRSLAAQYLWARVPGLNLEAAREIAGVCDVRSRTFEVQVDAEVGGYKRQFIAIVGRNSPSDVQTLSFYWK